MYLKEEDVQFGVKRFVGHFVFERAEGEGLKGWLGRTLVLEKPAGSSLLLHRYSLLSGVGTNYFPIMRSAKARRSFRGSPLLALVLHAMEAHSRYADIVRTMGKDLFDKVNSSRVLVVGAGGIGCELLKNLVLMGFENIEIVSSLRFPHVSSH